MALAFRFCSWLPFLSDMQNFPIVVVIAMVAIWKTLSPELYQKWVDWVAVLERPWSSGSSKDGFTSCL